MSVASKSALNVQYDLRPAKQVERRMFVDAFQRLAQIGFPIREYQYTGFGSIHFVDFLVFHKLLGIHKMLSIEHDMTLEDRVKFNCPFNCVGIEMGSAIDVIPKLSRDLHHILWLDYDFPITSEMLDEIYLAGTQLSRGSIFIVTVDVEPPERGSDDPCDTMNYFKRESGNYLGLFTVEDFAKSMIPKTSVRIIKNALEDGLSGRVDIDFLPIFHFKYADGHKMVTVGGIIGSDDEKQRINALDKRMAFYLRTDLLSDPYEIVVPVLTRKERHFLDSEMPCQEDWHPDDFKLPQGYIVSYREIYRFLPAYGELLV